MYAAIYPRVNKSCSMFFKKFPLSFSFAESIVLGLQVNCKTFFVVILNGICLFALNIRVKTFRENCSCNYKHQLKRLSLKNKPKLNKWNNYKTYLCDKFWNKRKVEMRKFDCNSFRITGNTIFKKKLRSFVSKSVCGNPAESNWNSPTHSRRWSSCFSTVLWTTVMNEHWETK